MSPQGGMRRIRSWAALRLAGRIPARVRKPPCGNAAVPPGRNEICRQVERTGKDDHSSTLKQRRYGFCGVAKTEETPSELLQGCLSVAAARPEESARTTGYGL